MRVTFKNSADRKQSLRDFEKTMEPQFLKSISLRNFPLNKVHTLFFRMGGGIGDLISATESVLALKHFLSKNRLKAAKSEFNALFHDGCIAGTREFIQALGIFDHVLVRSELLNFSYRYPIHLMQSEPWFPKVDHVSLGSYRDLQWAKWGIPSPYRHIDYVAAARLKKTLNQEFLQWTKKFPGVCARQTLIICPESASLQEHKDWGDEKWHELIKKILRQYDFSIVVLTSSSSLTKRLKGLKKIYCFDFTNKKYDSNLMTLAGIVANSRGLIGVDTGPTQLAGLFKIPCITLFGPTSPVFFSHPRNLNLRTSTCPPCHYSFRNKECRKNVCMSEIDVASVFVQTEKMLQGNFYPHEY